MHPALQSTAHRPWPLPQGPWTMLQTWHDLLFAHWPIEQAVMRSLVPSELPLDTFDGQCWIGIVPFGMRGIRARGIPAIPGLSRFPELNVRTYVSVGGKPGVYFFSLDAANLTAVKTARLVYHLPYFHARMSLHVDEETVTYNSQRKLGNADFRGRYRPIQPVVLREKGTLEHWLSERYCLYTTHAKRIYRAEIHHQQWPLQDAEADIEMNTMAAAAAFSLPAIKPLLHFAKNLEVLIWPLRRLQT